MENPDLKIPNVEVHEPLGKGGFGVVYKGRHQTLDVDVAVKIIHSQEGDAGAIDRSLFEARLMARLDHPNLLRIHDAGRSGSDAYLVLELMDESCSKLRNAPLNRSLDLTRQLLSGLQCLHDARILHRDIKPDNCLVRLRDGRTKLADLGIAIELATKTDQNFGFAGTIPFMAPELFEDHPQFSPKSDLYALGLSLTCMILTKDPFPGSAIPRILNWIHAGTRPVIPVERPDLPSALTGLLQRMISPKADERPASAAESLAAIGGIKEFSPPADKHEALKTTVVCGPWILGDEVRVTPNWRSYVVSHTHTGLPARLSHLQPNAPLSDSNDLVLASAERASRLEHPGIVNVLDWGTKDGFAYVVTAPQGQRLESMVQSAGPLQEIEALTFVCTLADALTFLHDKGLVYQIVDPGSAVISQDARSVQLSWPMFCIPVGASVRDESGKLQRVLVPQYAAPETLGDDHGRIYPSVDVYGLGEVLFYLLTGQSAFGRIGMSAQLIYKKLQSPPDVRNVSPTVTALTATLLAWFMNPDPEARPKNAMVARDELVRIINKLK